MYYHELFTSVLGAKFQPQDALDVVRRGRAFRF